MTEITFTFNGAGVAASAGQSLAAALIAAGRREFRVTAGGKPRGVFCGIGVCQDCLVTVDGTPNRRACMTGAVDGMAVETQSAFPGLRPDAEVPDTPRARVLTPDVLVIGGGAGGLSATIAARRAGAEVVTLDERAVPGGQYYKQSAEGGLLDAQQAEGATLVEDARASGAEIIKSVEIWGAFDGPLILAESENAALIVRPRTVIVATGAYDRPIIVPGWTLPGVMTTGAAQTLWRSYRTLPGRRIVVCGSGPLNLQVALELAVGGAEIALVAEAAPSAFRHPLRGARCSIHGPTLAWKGLAMLCGLRWRRVPVRNGLRLAAVEQYEGGLSATFRRTDGGTCTVRADAVCMNAGFEPQNEILRLLGARMTYDPAVGHLRCERSQMLETSVSGIFAIGDCAGLGGAPAACAEGRIAGRSAAALSGHGDGRDLASDRRALRRHRRFQNALWQLHDVSPTPLDRLPEDTVLCRCEEVTVGETLAGYAVIPGHLGTLKRATRIGMGPCQGRYCGPAAARLIAEKTGEALTDRSFFAPRVPVKPVTINAIFSVEEALRGDE